MSVCANRAGELCGPHSREDIKLDKTGSNFKLSIPCISDQCIALLNQPNAQRQIKRETAGWLKPFVAGFKRGTSTP